MIKDIWIDSDRMREGNIVASLHAAANDEEKELVEKRFLTTICHGDVWIEPDTLDDTANALMRGLNIARDHDSLFKLQQKPSIPTHDPPSGSDHLRVTTRVQVPRLNLGYADKIHYRVVFKEQCTTIDKMRSLPDVMTVLSETVGGEF